jgi:hypothetical protein
VLILAPRLQTARNCALRTRAGLSSFRRLVVSDGAGVSSVSPSSEVPVVSTAQPSSQVKDICLPLNALRTAIINFQQLVTDGIVDVEMSFEEWESMDLDSKLHHVMQGTTPANVVERVRCWHVAAMLCHVAPCCATAPMLTRMFEPGRLHNGSELQFACCDTGPIPHVPHDQTNWG